MSVDCFTGNLPTALAPAAAPAPTYTATIGPVGTTSPTLCSAVLTQVPTSTPSPLATPAPITSPAPFTFPGAVGDQTTPFWCEDSRGNPTITYYQYDVTVEDDDVREMVLVCRMCNAVTPLFGYVTTVIDRARLPHCCLFIT